MAEGSEWRTKSPFSRSIMHPGLWSHHTFPLGCSPTGIRRLWVFDSVAKSEQNLTSGVHELLLQNCCESCPLVIAMLPLHKDSHPTLTTRRNAKLITLGKIACQASSTLECNSVRSLVGHPVATSFQPHRCLLVTTPDEFASPSTCFQRLINKSGASPTEVAPNSNTT